MYRIKNMDEHIQKTLKLINSKDYVGNEHKRCEISSSEASDVELLDAYSRAVIKVVEAVGPSVISVSIGKQIPIYRQHL